MSRFKHLIAKFLVIACMTSPFCVGMYADDASIIGSDDDGEETYENDIVAIVNDKIITRGQLDRDVALETPRLLSASTSKDSFRRNVKLFRKTALRARIERALIVSEFSRKGGNVPETLEKGEYDRIVREYFDGDRLAFSNHMRESGQTIREFKGDIREGAIVGFVINSLPGARQEVSPAQIEEYYNRNIGEFYIGRQVFLYEISLDDGKYDKNGLDSKLAEIKEKLSQMCDIKDVVRNYSDFPKTAEVGWIKVSDLVPEYVSAIEEYKSSGKFVEVKSGGKTTILFVSKEKSPTTATIEDASDEIREKLAAANVEKAREDYIERLRERAYIKIFVPSLAE